MSDLILHHYPNSPFAEKIRLIFGAKKLAWRSVHIPMIMPKPDVIALTGGYRRTPILQVGADVYCDTALICDFLENRAPTATLYPTNLKGAARVLAQWADSTLFQAAMAYNFQPKGAQAMFPDPEQLKIFAQDRAAMRNNAPRMPLPEATAAYKSYLRRIASMLDGQDYLLGSAPCVADYAIYHPLWFTRTRVPTVAGILDATPQVLAWMDRMAACGHGQPEKFSADEAIQIAKSSTPLAMSQEVFQDEHGIPLGSHVTITAESFGLEVTSGKLIAATRTRYTLARSDERAGELHVHFPRVGYVLQKAEH
jgi:glutathione S-transferase